MKENIQFLKESSETLKLMRDFTFNDRDEATACVNGYYNFECVVERKAEGYKSDKLLIKSPVR